MNGNGTAHALQRDELRCAILQAHRAYRDFADIGRNTLSWEGRCAVTRAEEAAIRVRNALIEQLADVETQMMEEEKCRTTV